MILDLEHVILEHVIIFRLFNVTSFYVLHWDKQSAIPNTPPRPAHTHAHAHHTIHAII